MIGLNCGSGQRPFGTFGSKMIPRYSYVPHRSAGDVAWVNLDVNPKWNPDLVADWNRLDMFEDASVDYVVSCHSIEHVGCGEADGFIHETYRILKSNGSFIVIAPDMKALAQRWLDGQMTDQLYMTNVYGAFDGDETSRHRWGWSRAGLLAYLKRTAEWRNVIQFDNRSIPGADLPSDWWMSSVECVK